MRNATLSPIGTLMSRSSAARAISAKVERASERSSQAGRLVEQVYRATGRTAAGVN